MAVLRAKVRFMLLFSCALILAGCGEVPAAPSGMPALALTSPAFVAGEAIPTTYTCDGEDISPPLQWDAPPAGTQSFVLIMDDPDAPAGTWVHWVLFNIPAEARGLDGGIPSEPALADGARHGNNSWRRPGYGGPCPPSGTHRYYFRLYAVDMSLDLAPGATKADVLAAIEGHILAQGELIGTYSRDQ